MLEHLPLLQRAVGRACAQMGLLADRDDVLQEVLLRAWKCLPDFRGRAQLSTYLYSVAWNTAREHGRWARRHPQDSEARCELLEGALWSHPDRRCDVVGAVRSLSRPHQEILALAAAGYEAPEMARRLRIPVATARTRLHYARKYLRLILDGETPRWDA